MVLGTFPTDIRCPCCKQGTLKPHGFYRRYIDEKLTAVRRGRCPSCGVTHAILPADVCAYTDFSLDDLAKVLTARGPTQAAELLGVSGDAWIRRIRRWRRQAREPRARQAERVLPGLESPAPWWQRALEIYGSLPRWRMRQWETTGYFATVLLGLFRRGRPPWLTAEFST